MKIVVRVIILVALIALAVPVPGGLYVMAADVRSLGKGRTEVVLYRPTMGYKPITRSVRQWTPGEDADCPKLR